MSKLTLFIVTLTSCLYALTESETSYVWRLDAEAGKIIPVVHDDSEIDENDKNQEAMLNILMSTVTDGEGTWKKTAPFCLHCKSQRNNRGVLMADGEEHLGDGSLDGSDKDDGLKDEVLDCGKPVNFTYYDHLVGIQSRATHPHVPEPEVAMTFRSNNHKSGKKESVDIDHIERRLKKSKRDKPKSVDLYNQIGNFWRIKGDTQKSIECFRRALAVSPNNADVLLNLARVLFNLQYLDDAIFLTRRSLEVQPPDQNAWMQHFQLGEILKAYCHYQEAALHLRHVLELKPNYGPAITALQDMEAIPHSSIHVYTILIIIVLVLVVLVWVLSTLDIRLEDIWASTGFKVNNNNNNGLETNASSSAHPRFHKSRSGNGKR